jgi:hypothetical protein
MVRSFAELRSLTDEELEQRIDAQVSNTLLGVGFYRYELARRESERREQHMVDLTRTIEQLTWIVTPCTIGALIFALVALLAPRPV